MKITSIAAVLALVLCGAARAQDGAANLAQRDANQQQRIAEGLQSGQLSVRDAGHLERAAQRIESELARMLSDGRADAREQDRLAREQEYLSQQIARFTHDSATADPNEISARRLAESVQHSAAQQRRIARGLESGALATREASGLEAARARVSAMQADATGDGYVGGAEQGAIRGMQRRVDQRIYASNRNDRRRERDIY